MFFLFKYLYKMHAVLGPIVIGFMELWSRLFAAVGLFVVLAMLITEYPLFGVVLGPLQLAAAMVLLAVAVAAFVYLQTLVSRVMRRVSNNGRQPVISGQLNPWLMGAIPYWLRRFMLFGTTVLFAGVAIGFLVVLVKSYLSGAATPMFLLVSGLLAVFALVMGIFGVLASRCVIEQAGIVTSTRGVGSEMLGWGMTPNVFSPELRVGRAPAYKTLLAVFVMLACLMGFVFLTKAYTLSGMGAVLALLPLTLLPARVFGNGRGAGSVPYLSRWVVWLYFGVTVLVTLGGMVQLLSLTNCQTISFGCVLCYAFFALMFSALIVAVSACVCETCYAVLGEKKPESM